MGEERQLPHKLILSERKHLTVTGVNEVVGFDETGVVLRTGTGTLMIQGRELQLKSMTPEDGQVVVEGLISALAYAEGGKSGGWIRRLLG
jgi:sporulation protein YabP